MHRVTARLACAVLVAGVAAGCSDSLPTGNTNEPHQTTETGGTPGNQPKPTFTKVVGDSQITIPRGAMPLALSVLALDGRGHPIDGLLVHWTADGGSRIRESDTTRTKSNGTAVVHWIAGRAVGAYHATARIDSFPALSFTARADTAAAIVRVRIVPDTARFASIGDTATFRLEVTTNGVPVFQEITSYGFNTQSTVTLMGTPLRATALRNGTALISTYYGDSLLFATVIVRQVPVGREIVLAHPVSDRIDTLTVGVADPTQLVLTAVDARGNAIADSSATPNVDWQTSDSTIAVIDSRGVARGSAEGVTRVIARSQGVSTSTRLRVFALNPADIVTTFDQTCVRRTDAAMTCWGSREYIYNPASPPTYALAPEPQPQLGTFDQFDMAQAAGCGLRNGRAWCWGDNSFGQLGYGAVGGLQRTPVQIAGNLTLVQVKTGEGSACGLTATGQAWCWGDGGGGILGNGAYGTEACYGSEHCESRPVAVAGGLTFTTLTVSGAVVCGLTADGTAWCWGYNDYGQLGSPRVGCAGWWNGQPNERWCSTVPVPVSGGLKFSSIVTGGLHTCGLTFDGTAYCWGSNVFGELGNGNAGVIFTETPTPVSTSLRFKSLAVTDTHSCGIATDDSAWCWGSGPLGIAGSAGHSCRGSSDCAISPVAVEGGLRFRSLSVGRNSCGLTTTNVAYCWGVGLIGDGDRNEYRFVPTLVLYQNP